MPNTIRLSKVLRELNISIDDACDYLDKYNIQIEKNPNAKLSEDIFKILKNHFGKSESNKETIWIKESREALKNLSSDYFMKAIRQTLGRDKIKYTKAKTKNTLSFTNFRRFPHFKETEFNDLTFLVGQNNSGKSTFVKAYMLIKSFLASGNIDCLNFSYTGVEDLNIVTYSRAKCKSLNVPEENAIDFTFKEEGLEYYLKVTGNDKDVDAHVINFNIKDPNSGIILKFLPNNLTVEFDNKSGLNYEELQSRAKFLEIALKKSHDNRARIKDQLSNDYINFNTEITKLKSSIKEVKDQLKVSKNNFSLSYDFKINNFDLILINFINEFKREYAIHYQLSHSEKFNQEKLVYFEALQVFNDNIKELENIHHEVTQNTNNSKFKYLPASLNKQSSLFAIRDVHNPLAQVIHEFMQLKIYESKDDADFFVKKWMQEDHLQIGEKVKIKLLEGEAYSCLIRSNKIDVPLADKGMGSIQAMLLILRIATIIHKQQRYGGQYTLIIEEPELNLHPALQSKLCEMFYDAYTNYGIKFIIETHSEYIIRRSQLFVKELKDFDSNPFATIYFDKDITKEEFVWNMEYREDGKFSNEFGSGFFDESTNLAFDLF